MASSIAPISSTKYRGRFAVAAPEAGIPYLAEAELTIVAPHDRHSHADIQVLWVVDGELGMEVGRRLLRAPAGSGLVLLPGRRHRVNLPTPDAAGSRARIVDLRLTGTSDDALAGFIHRLPPHQVLAGDPAAVAAGADAIRQALEAGGPVRTARLLSAVWELLAAISVGVATSAEPLAGDRPAAAGPSKEVDRRLLAAEQFVADRLADPIGVDAIADAVGLSRSQLTRLAIRYRGVGPAELLRNARVDQARRLLRTSTLAIKEVARVCGFVSQNHFSRVYYEVTGGRPSAERRG